MKKTAKIGSRARLLPFKVDFLPVLTIHESLKGPSSVGYGTAGELVSLL